MDAYVADLCHSLGWHKLLKDGFPTTEQMAFIQMIVGQNDVKEALVNHPEETAKFEKDGLKGRQSAEFFFAQLVGLMERGGYRSASIRMDMQVSTRTIDDAPDCKINMDLRTVAWDAKLNMSYAMCEKMMLELKDAKTAIRQAQAEELEAKEG